MEIWNPVDGSVEMIFNEIPPEFGQSRGELATFFSTRINCTQYWRIQHPFVGTQYPACYPVPESGSTSLETGYVSRIASCVLSLLNLLRHLEAATHHLSCHCWVFELCVCVINKRINSVTVKWLCLIWFSKYSLQHLIKTSLWITWEIWAVCRYEWFQRWAQVVSRLKDMDVLCSSCRE